ncbi:MAG: neutral zinc metallopeptidase [Bryobacteraceae bacterium]|nr:neutral zinc metallopeptidase [Bryobacteraceae bacterium]
MRWTPGGRSDNLEDRRGGGGGFRLPIGGRGAGLGLGGLLLALVVSLLTGTDFLSLIGMREGGAAVAPAGTESPVRDSQEEPMVEFVSFVLDDAQSTWARLLGGRYEATKLVLFRDGVRSGCGYAGAETGPFYCPADGKVYLDLSFFRELDRRFGAPGDFAQAYVVAHEIGHHVQNVTGTAQQVRQAQRRNPGAANEYSVRLELQADCYAGVWGHHTGRKGVLEEGDVDEGLRAAQAIGDDRLQRLGRGEVNPETFTHGTSEQRARWLRRGLETGRVEACDTFGQ